MTAPQTQAEPMEPVLRPIDVDMTTIGERDLVPIGEPVYTIFANEFALGTTRIELQINGQWLRISEGDAWDLGDCTPTLRGVKIRTQPALAGLFSNFIIGGTPSSVTRQ